MLHGNQVCPRSPRCPVGPARRRHEELLQYHLGPLCSHHQVAEVVLHLMNCIGLTALLEAFIIREETAISEESLRSTYAECWKPVALLAITLSLAEQAQQGTQRRGKLPHLGNADALEVAAAQLDRVNNRCNRDVHRRGKLRTRPLPRTLRGEARVCSPEVGTLVGLQPYGLLLRRAGRLAWHCTHGLLQLLPLFLLLLLHPQRLFLQLLIIVGVKFYNATHVHRATPLEDCVFGQLLHLGSFLLTPLPVQLLAAVLSIVVEPLEVVACAPLGALLARLRLIQLLQLLCQLLLLASPVTFVHPDASVPGHSIR
mmetsp:Transcript_5165/g.14240  ORF Transcript_5165/g.14240 Transcript_5165/m.14240 type:complete len:313 (-) Transcript_5165:991-1929(-)